MIWNPLVGRPLQCPSQQLPRCWQNLPPLWTRRSKRTTLSWKNSIENRDEDTRLERNELAECKSRSMATIGSGSQLSGHFWQVIHVIAILLVFNLLIFNCFPMFFQLSLQESDLGNRVSTLVSGCSGRHRSKWGANRTFACLCEREREEDNRYQTRPLSSRLRSSSKVYAAIGINSLGLPMVYRDRQD